MQAWKGVSPVTDIMSGKKAKENEEALKYVQEQLTSLQYGTITMIVQDGVVVQVEKTEKKRISRS